MLVQKLIIYPIKGMKGIELPHAKAMERGFENDRRFMLVNEDGKFLSQREFSEMALFETKIIENRLVVKYKGERLSIDLNIEQGKEIETTVWKHTVKAIEVNARANQWFSEKLNMNCRLVKMNKTAVRKKSLIKAPSTTELSFADGYPYLVLGTASLDLLNDKLETPVPMDRFRANIIVNSTDAHEEDEVDKFTLSGTKFRMIKPCARCQVITINQDNAVASKEPLKTLATYRKKANKIYFGMNAVCLGEGVIKVGDELLHP